jgi:hypothetical protein
MSWCKCCLALLLPLGALAQCHFDPNNPVCIPDNGGGSTGLRTPIYWAALAVSDSTLQSGSSHGQASEAAARQIALKNCGTHAKDCKIVNWGNVCFALAVNRATGAYGQDFAQSRAAAGAKAMARCPGGNANCVVQAAPCATDDARWPSPLPLPPASSKPAATIDPRTIGAWELSLNPGRWIWEIAPNGTYEFHSESPDKAPSHAGTFSANDGRWSLHSTEGYSDSGTYKFAASGSMLSTGRLGTGAWRRIN